MSIECFHGDDPAFPRAAFLGPNGELEAKAQDGLTLRDYFAAKAMAALIASNDEEAGDRIEDIPTYAYQIADAMVAARATPQA